MGAITMLELSPTNSGALARSWTAHTRPCNTPSDTYRWPFICHCSDNNIPYMSHAAETRHRHIHADLRCMNPSTVHRHLQRHQRSDRAGTTITRLIFDDVTAVRAQR
jgi:hypothetical protein